MYSYTLNLHDPQPSITEVKWVLGVCVCVCVYVYVERERERCCWWYDPGTHMNCNADLDDSARQEWPNQA